MGCFDIPGDVLPDPVLPKAEVDLSPHRHMLPPEHLVHHESAVSTMAAVLCRVHPVVARVPKPCRRARNGTKRGSRLTGMGEASGNDGLVLVYDGECPVCSTYVRYMRIKKSVGDLTLINARESGEWVQRVRSAGYDLDEGMVLIYGGRIYHGADCINMLALLSSRSGLFNRVNAAIFRHEGLSRVLYPVLRSGRNLLLRLLGREKLETS
jgi:predicted DCC family thiol-disulfide oxidoreductase YuxK